MSIIGWIILGLIAGFIASKIVNRQGEGFFLDIILGVVGAVVGGWLWSVRYGRGEVIEPLQPPRCRRWSHRVPGRVSRDRRAM